jgi:DNA-binding IclR family transcriptional regulator
MRHIAPAEASSLERGRQILEWLSKAPGGEARVRELTDALGIPRASLYRVIKSLLHAGWLEETTDGGKYRMGQGLAALGFSARANCPLVHAARPILQEIAQETHLMSELVVSFSPTRIVVLDSWCTEHTALSVAAHYGESQPLNHIMTHGRCFIFSTARTAWNAI